MDNFSIKKPTHGSLLHQRCESNPHVEQTPDLEYIDEVDWNDRAYYEIEYFMKNGAKAEIKIDPKTGEPVR